MQFCFIKQLLKTKFFLDKINAVSRRAKVSNKKINKEFSGEESMLRILAIKSWIIKIQPLIAFTFK
jgi:hypothetical protein